MAPSPKTFVRFGCVLLTCAACRPTASAAPALPVRLTSPARLSGCYALYTVDGKSVDGRFYNASPLVRLDTQRIGRVTAPGVYRRLVRLDGAGNRLDAGEPRESFGPLWARAEKGDSIEISFSDGFSGAALVLGASGVGDTLRGRIEEHWDLGPSTTSQGRAYAVRVPCRNP